MSPIDQLPILPVILPLLAAPLCVLLEAGGRAWLVAVITAWMSLTMAAALLWQVTLSGSVSYALGGWPAPWGIEYRVDLLGGYVLLIVTSMAALVLSFARLSVVREIPKERVSPFYAAFLLVLAGLAGITVTGDAFNLFVFMEISSLASYALISSGRDRRALSAAFQYLIMGTIGATFVLIGIGFLYMMTGTLNLQDLAARLPAVSDTRTLMAGFAFLTVGISLKLALFPLHMWLPDAYAHAPSAVTAFLSATATKVAVYVLLRFLLEVFGVRLSLGEMHTDALLLVLGLAGILSASLTAVFQDDIKRMFAYSSVAQVGYIILGVSLASENGIKAAILHLFNHALMKGALFMALGCLAYRVGKLKIGSLGGLGRRMPWTMVAFLVGALSIVGVPPMGGTWSKWFLVQGTLDAEAWTLTAVLLLSSVLNLFYLVVIPVRTFFAPPADVLYGQGVKEAPLACLLAIGVTTLGCVLLFLAPDPLVGMALVLLARELRKLVMRGEDYYAAPSGDDSTGKGEDGRDA